MRTIGLVTSAGYRVAKNSSRYRSSLQRLRSSCSASCGLLSSIADPALTICRNTLPIRAAATVTIGRAASGAIGVPGCPRPARSALQSSSNIAVRVERRARTMRRRSRVRWAESNARSGSRSSRRCWASSSAELVELVQVHVEVTAGPGHFLQPAKLSPKVRELLSGKDGTQLPLQRAGTPHAHPQVMKELDVVSAIVPGRLASISSTRRPAISAAAASARSAGSRWTSSLDDTPPGMPPARTTASSWSETSAGCSRTCVSSVRAPASAPCRSRARRSRAGGAGVHAARRPRATARPAPAERPSCSHRRGRGAGLRRTGRSRRVSTRRSTSGKSNSRRRPVGRSAARQVLRRSGLVGAGALAVVALEQRQAACRRAPATTRLDADGRRRCHRSSAPRPQESQPAARVSAPAPGLTRRRRGRPATGTAWTQSMTLADVTAAEARRLGGQTAVRLLTSAPVGVGARRLGARAGGQVPHGDTGHARVPRIGLARARARGERAGRAHPAARSVMRTLRRRLLLGAGASVTKSRLA